MPKYVEVTKPTKPDLGQSGDFICALPLKVCSNLHFMCNQIVLLNTRRPDYLHRCLV